MHKLTNRLTNKTAKKGEFQDLLSVIRGEEGEGRKREGG